MLLDRLGFSAQFAESFESLDDPALVPARVVKVDGNLATVYGESAEVVVRVPEGVRRRAGVSPVTGDWVAIDAAGAVVRSILPRKSALARQAAGSRTERQVIAANVDRVLVLMGLDGDFNLRRLERYLTLVYDAGAEPVVLLTKAGLVQHAQAQAQEVERIAPGVPVHAIDVVCGIAGDVPRSYLPAGMTAVLVGSSGVGKSTLINHLLGAERVTTAPVRPDDERGRHTTTRRELWLVPPDGGAVIDTPGMRELQLWADERSLDMAFADIEAIAQRCRFRDCRHAGEPGCAVLAAVERGELDRERLDSRRRLDRELRAHSRRRSEHAKRAQGRAGARLVRAAKRMKERGGR